MTVFLDQAKRGPYPKAHLSSLAWSFIRRMEALKIPLDPPLRKGEGLGGEQNYVMMINFNALHPTALHPTAFSGMITRLGRFPVEEGVLHDKKRRP